MICLGCRHPVANHSEVCGCLMCRCSYVRRDNITINPGGKYAAEFIQGETALAEVL